MSHETKVGLVVSCSFLCLVGVVVFCKLREGGTTAAPEKPAVASEEKLPPEPSPAPTKESAPAAEVVVAVPGAGNLEPAKQVEPLSPVPSAGSSAAIRQAAAVEDGKGSSSSSTPAPPAPFLNCTGGNNATTRPSAEPAGAPTPPAPELSSPAPPAPSPAAAVPAPPPPAPASPSVPPVVTPTTRPRPEEQAAAPAKPAGAEGNPAFVGPPAPPGTTKHKKAPDGMESGSPGEKSTTPPVPPPAAPVAAPALPVAPTPAASPRPESAANLGKPVPAPGAVPAAEKTEPPPPAAVPRVPVPAPAAPPPQVKLGSPAVPPANQFAQGPPPPGPAPRRTPPPVGAAPTATSPALVVPSAPAAQVESFDEETYPCRPGDTFDSVSRAKYQTPKYAQALLLYNRDHPLAGDNFQGGVTTLRAGQAIYLPPTVILEKRFANAIRDSSPPASGAPAPFTARGMNPSAGVAYRVGAGGEYLRAVAMRALGDSERWQEVLQLNPTVNLALPVPAGTVLRLPADARVPSENLP